MIVEFIKETHQYLINGILVPCVSDILKFKFPDKYEGIDERILNKKAEFGTKVHKHTEHHDKGYAINMKDLPLYERLCLEQHIKLSYKYDIKPSLHEEIIYNEKLGYAGTLDVIASVDCICSIIDKKCTAKLDIEYVTWQNSLYYWGIPAKTRSLIKKSYVEWLPKGDLGQLKELKIIPYKDIKTLVKEYKEANNESHM